MRLNRFLANSSGLSRRGADDAIAAGRVTVNGNPTNLGQRIEITDVVTLDGKALAAQTKNMVVVFNKPVGYVCSRNGQGSQTIYDLLPPQYQRLQPVGRLDKDSSGLLLLTNNGLLANELSHPKFEKQKVYEVELAKPISPSDLQKILQGIKLEEGISQFDELTEHGDDKLTVSLHQGWNRQIRRTFGALGYNVTKLHRTKLGNYVLPSNLGNGEFSEVDVL